MAGKGNTIPKPDSERRRTNEAPKTVHAEPPAAPLGPDLPTDVVWPAQTRAWWANWRTSHVATRFVALDWDFLLDTALLHRELWSTEPNLAVLPELRLRLSKMGATAEDRLRLRIELKTEGAGSASQEVDTDAIIKRLKLA